MIYSIYKINCINLNRKRIPLNVKTLKRLKRIYTFIDSISAELISLVGTYPLAIMLTMFMMNITRLQNILKLQLSKRQNAFLSCAGIDAN